MNIYGNAEKVFSYFDYVYLSPGESLKVELFLMTDYFTEVNPSHFFTQDSYYVPCERNVEISYEKAVTLPTMLTTNISPLYGIDSIQNNVDAKDEKHEYVSTNITQSTEHHLSAILWPQNVVRCFDNHTTLDFLQCSQNCIDEKVNEFCSQHFKVNIGKYCFILR